jgi:hypothetical protein
MITASSVSAKVEFKGDLSETSHQIAVALHHISFDHTTSALGKGCDTQRSNHDQYACAGVTASKTPRALPSQNPQAFWPLLHQH